MYGTDMEIELFPNPAQQEIFIQFSQALEEDAAAIIYNMQGQLVSRHQILAEGNIQNRLALPDLSNGLYKIAIRLADGQMMSHSFVVQR